MNPAEAVMLTGYIQAHFPSTPINEFTPDALHELLRNYPAEDCRAAVLAHVATARDNSRAFCAPSDVLAGVKRIRGARIAQDDEYAPPPGLNPDNTGEYAGWLRSKREAMADGREVVGALEAGTRDVGTLGQLGQPDNVRAEVERLREARREGLRVLADARQAEVDAEAEKRLQQDADRERARATDRAAIEARAAEPDMRPLVGRDEKRTA